MTPPYHLLLAESPWVPLSFLAILCLLSLAPWIAANCRTFVKAGKAYSVNHRVDGAGYYHPRSRHWYPGPWNFFHEEKGYYWDGEWHAKPGVLEETTSTPTEMEIDRVNARWRKTLIYGPEEVDRFGFGTGTFRTRGS